MIRIGTICGRLFRIICIKVDDVLKIEYPGGNFTNPWYSYYNLTQRRDFALSATLADFMVANGDRRVFAYGSANAAGTSVKGFPYGLTRTDAVNWSNANTDWARVISNSLRTEDMPVPILTSSQIWLARAEAAQLGWTADVVATAYANGIERGWRQWGVYDAVLLATYLADPDISLAGGSVLAKIFRQRWIAAYPDGQEAWNIWREANSSANQYLVLAPAPGTGLAIPVRFGIAQSQFDLNPDNTNAVAALYTVNGEKDSQYARVWWDKW